MTHLLLRPKIHLFSGNNIVKKINYHVYLHPDVKKNLSGLKKEKNFVFLFLSLAIIRKLRHRFAREFDTLKSKIFDRVRSELFFLSNLFYIFVVYISKYCKYETCN